ncbi:hypothetical protein [Bremerella sp.]
MDGWPDNGFPLITDSDDNTALLGGGDFREKPCTPGLFDDSRRELAGF